MKKYQIILISFAALLLIMGAASAAEVDDITNDTIVSDISVSDDILCANNYSDVVRLNKEFNGNTFSELQNEIDGCSDSDTIILNKDIIQDESNKISIKKALTINGNGHTIDAQQKSGIFYIEGAAEVILKNITFKNAKENNGAVIQATSGILHVDNCTFMDNVAENYGGAIYTQAISYITDCNFTGNSAKYGGAIYSDGADEKLYFNNFINNTAKNDGGAVFLNSLNQNDIEYNSFINNSADKGGALYVNNSNADIVSTLFLNNTAVKGGAISSINSTCMVEYCDFEYNSADEGGAILLNNSQGSIDGSYFDFNTAYKKGSAIYWAPLTANLNCSVTGSEFFNNKVKSYSLKANLTKGSLFLELTGWNNFFNAIYADSDIKFRDVRYWNGNRTNSDLESYHTGASGQNITLEIYDSKKNLLVNTTLTTNVFGQQYYNMFLFNDADYTYKAYLSNEDYYTYIACSGKFTLKRFASSISLNISDCEEFTYGKCVVPFDVVNRTDVRAVITNEDESVVYFNSTVNEYSRRVLVDLPASDEYYKITVYNLPNSRNLGSQDSRLFKISRTSSSISIDPIKDFNYGRSPVVSFNVENMTYILVTVYDEDGRGVYATTADTDYIFIPVLNVGKYNLYAENMKDENISSSTSSATFNILKEKNWINVSANKSDYGNRVILTVKAWVDGKYTIDVNGTLMNVSVVRGNGEISLYLPAGQYYANAIFNNPNYDTVITNANFTVLPESNMQVDYNEDVVNGESITFNVAVNNGATGNIKLLFGNDEYTAAIDNGNAVIEVSNVSSGNHDVSVIYEGDENYAADKIDNSVHVKTYGIMLGAMQSDECSVRLYDEDGNGVSNREVLFSIDGQTLKSVTDSEGIASINPYLNPGFHTIEVIYLTLNITKHISVAPAFSGNKNINMYYFDGTKYSFRVYDDNGNPVGADQKVVVTLNKQTYTVKTNANGYASLQIPNTVKTGTYTITATYRGETIKNTVKVKQILSSKKTVNVKKTAKKLVLQVKLYKKLKGKSISFKFYGKTYKVKTDKNGIAKVTIKKSVINKLKKGKSYTVNIYYSKISLKTKVKAI
ncbi:Ig-like domain repeat protein [Methanobrevibacter sp.]|uniref:Ig-like domain repeat protein n=1 Tax=Methanobrevibacter sp. TaxID=66852 RepID=UPI00388DBAE5